MPCDPRRAILLLGLLLLSACAGPPAPRETFHRLEVPPVAARLAKPALAGVLEIDRVETEGVLAERAIAYQAAAGALQRYLYEFWSDPPGVMVQDAIAGRMRDAGIADTVVTPDLRVPPDWVLKAKLKRFEHLPESGQAVVRMQVSVISARNGALLLLTDYEAEAGGATPATVAPAMGRAVAEAVGRLVADVGRLTPAARP